MYLHNGQETVIVVNLADSEWARVWQSAEYSLCPAKLAQLRLLARLTDESILAGA